MQSLTTSSARTTIDVAEASEIARMARQRDPNILSTDDMQALLGHSALVLDGQRRRPRYFDGRFLTGADLTRDQDYVRQRQADLARASGSGVALGLEVTLDGAVTGQTLVIQPGHGITPAGDLVMVTTTRAIPLLDLAASRQLDASLGLRLEPRMPLGRRTGLFLLVLRPVEFTANPIAAYPTSVSGPRQVEDGDIIEATAVDLIPFPDTGGAASLAEARRAVARRLFLGEAVGLPQNALPLAMVALERGAARWIDTALVRRETGADTPLQVSMGSRPRALAEAFVLQHRRHLADVLADRIRGGLPPAFAAAQYFAALPAAGQLPAAAILADPLGFRQLWFPPAVDVDLSFVPSDEVAALVEESLALPPIDLAGDPADLDATGVIVMAPVTRQRLQRFEAALGGLSHPVLPDPAPGIRRVPATMLAALLSRRVRPGLPTDPAAVARLAQADAEIKQWQTAWAEAVAAIPVSDGLPPLLWYMRRRAVAYESRMTGVAVTVSGNDEQLKLDVDKHLADLQLTDRVNKITARATPFAAARMLALLGAPRISGSTILTAAAVHDLETALPPAAPPGGGGGPQPGGPPVAPPAAGGPPAPVRRIGFARLVTARLAPRPDGQPHLLTEGDVIDVAADYADPSLGDGLDRLTAALRDRPLDQKASLWIGGTGQALGLDRVARDVDAAVLPAFAASVATIAGKGNDAAATELAALIARGGSP
jgi:hypothetical protein